jgi:hypothetical protein
MVKKKHGVIIETPMEARQAERGPSILLLLVASVSIAVIHGNCLVRVLSHLISRTASASVLVVEIVHCYLYEERSYQAATSYSRLGTSSVMTLNRVSLAFPN